MKRSGLLNGPLSAVIAHLGHTDTLAIGDAGLPVPAGPARIDLALLPGLPGFLDVLRAVGGEMMIEHAAIALELGANPAFRSELLHCIAQLGEAQGRPIIVDDIPHAALKAATASTRAVVRTGECTPYANIILRSGVCF